MASRNPAWSREELILALDLYCRHQPTGADDPEVIALSELLNRLPLHRDRPDAARFRNPNGVYMKLQNFRRLDPQYTGKGLTRGNKLEEVIWREFIGEPRELEQEARNLAAAARTSKVAETATGGRTARLDPDVAAAFPDDAVINRALRELISIAQGLC